jgi:hypothetical protein
MMHKNPFTLLVFLVLVGGLSCSRVSGNEEGFVSLFNGKNLSGWIGAKDQYRIEDGVIVLPEGRSGKLLTKKEYDNFVLKFDFKLTAGANNGLAIRAPVKGDAAYNGMELQILDNGSDRWPDLKPYQRHGSIYGVAPAKRGFLKPVGRWNEQEVICDGRNIRVVLNGHLILDANLDAVASGSKTIDGQDHPGLNNTKGHLGFLGHGDCVSFRNIRLRPLEPSSKKQGVQEKE